jgi:hypothetical protein
MSKGGKPGAGTRLVIARFPVPGRKVWPRPVKHKACGFPVNHPYATLVMRKAKQPSYKPQLHETSVEEKTQRSDSVRITAYYFSGSGR